MNIAFEINHPAQAHLFKNTIARLKANHHSVFVYTKASTIIESILDEASIQYTILGAKGSNLFEKAFKQLYFAGLIFSAHRNRHFDLGVGVSVSMSFLSKVSGMDSIIFDDDDTKATPLFAFLSHKNASVLFRPNALIHEGQSDNRVYYKSYHEAAYLHPQYFTPDASILQAQNIKYGETFFIIRLVALNAHHDRGIRGIQKKFLLRIIDLLKPYGRVLITHENDTTLQLGVERILIPAEKIHHLMAYARLIISDGQTMCSEAACLGVPSIRINDFVGRISYLEEQEKKWNLTFGFKPDQFNEALSRIKEVLHQPISLYKNRSQTMWKDMINLTDFLVWFIENYPESKRIMKENPAYQYNFR